MWSAEESGAGLSGGTSDFEASDGSDSSRSVGMCNAEERGAGLSGGTLKSESAEVALTARCGALIGT